LPGRIEAYGGETEVEPGVDATVNVVFPPILEHDTQQTVAAIVSAATLDGKSEAGTVPRDELAKQLMSAIGVEDIQAALEEVEKEREERQKEEEAQAEQEHTRKLEQVQARPVPTPQD